MTTLVVMAKECVPGRVKTRLTPPFTPETAARIAEASLRDTLRAGASLPVERRVLCFDGTAPPEDSGGWEVVPQDGDGLDGRIAEVLDHCHDQTLLIGMDTPHLTEAHVAPALDQQSGFDAWLGPATDGGFWALGLREPRGDLVRGIPMSRADTGMRQLQRLRAAGLRVGILPPLTDIDTAESLAVVARELHDGHLSRLLRSAA